VAWLNDQASSFRGPLAVVILAAAMYAACAMAERAARPEALQDIARILKDPSWDAATRPDAIIYRVFIWTFGERQFSVKCCLAAVIATACVSLCVLFAYRPVTSSEMGYLLGLILFGILPDYLSLWKTRALLSRLVLLRSMFYLPSIILADMALSVCISASWLELCNYAIKGALFDIRTVPIGLIDTEQFNPISALFASTLFMSVWTLLILLSTAILKLPGPFHSFTVFDAGNRPVRAIGIVAGLLVLVGSLIWSLV
jgi:hypothetical protein